MHIVFLDRAALPTALPSLQREHTWRDHAYSDAIQVVERAAHADVLISNKVSLPADALRRLPWLRLIAVPATGTDHIDLAACAVLGIAVRNCPDYSALSVAEHAIALLLALRRNLFAYHESVNAGRWSDSPAFYADWFPTADLDGQTLGLFDAGTIGRRTAELAQAFGMDVLWAERRDAAEPRAGYTAFEDVLRTSDAISLHCPLTDETHGLIGAAELGRMKPDAILINTARGGLVDEAALLDALLSRRIGGAGLDVLSVEAPPAGHPLLRQTLPNLVVTPHMAWRTPVSMRRLGEQLVAAIGDFCRSEALR